MGRRPISRALAVLFGESGGVRANNLPYPPEKLDAIFDMKVRVCACILEDEGGN